VKKEYFASVCLNPATLSIANKRKCISARSDHNQSLLNGSQQML